MDKITTHSFSEDENLAYLRSDGQKLQKYENLLSAKNEYIKGTTDSPTFKMLALTGWKQEGDSYYMVDKNNVKITGWFSECGLKYYLSPEKTDKFEKGEMVTGKVNIKGTDKNYYFNPEKGKKQGEMMTEWIKDENRRYYASPKDRTKNWNDKTFDRGELMTGWIEPNDGNTYFLSPKDGTKNYDGKVFDKGEIMTGWVRVNNDYGSVDGTGAWYYMDDPDNQLYKGILGRMLHDEKGRVKNSNGNYYDQYFNKNGTMQ